MKKMAIILTAVLAVCFYAMLCYAEEPQFPEPMAMIVNTNPPPIQPDICEASQGHNCGNDWICSREAVICCPNGYPYLSYCDCQCYPTPPKDCDWKYCVQ